MTRRILFTVLALGVVLYMPWWLMLLMALGGTFYFPRYYEVIILGALADLLYGISGGVFAGFGAQGLLAGVAIFVIMERVKRELR